MQIVLTRILSAAYSLARDLVRLRPAARVTEVGRARGWGALPPTVVMLTMRPPPRFFMWGMTRRDMRTAPMTLRSQSACHVSSSTFSKAAAAEVPALLRRMSMPPHWATTALTSLSQSAARLTSATWASTWPLVVLRISSAVWSRCSLRRAQIATRAPSAASFSAAARPSPSLPPVMMATLPLSPRSSMNAPADEEVGLRLHAVPVHDESAPDVDLTRPRLQDLDIGDDVADSRGRLFRPVDARENLSHATRERVLALVEPAGVDALPRELPLRLVARDVAPHGHPVVDVLGQELEPLLVPSLVEEIGLPVEEALDLLLDEEPLDGRRLGAHDVAISPQLSASMSWRQRV